MRNMIDFSDGQKKTIAAGITLLSFVVVLVFVGFIAVMAMKLFAITAPAVVPAILGFFLALFFRPYYAWWKRVAKNPTIALLAMLATVMLPIGVLCWYAGSVVLDQLFKLIQQSPQLAQQAVVWFQTTFPKFNALLQHFGLNDGDFVALYNQFGTRAIAASSGAVTSIFTILVSIIITLCFFVFFLTSKERKGSELVKTMPILKDSTRKFLAEQIDAFVDILVSFFQRQMVICLIEGVMYGTGFWLVGLPYGFVIGFMLGVLNLVPFFGSLVCLPIALPLAYLHHGGSSCLLTMVLLVWLTGQFLDGYLITPKIQGNKTGLGYAGVLFAFVFWSSILGPMMGLLLAIPLSAFCVVLWRALKSQYLHPVV